LVSICGRTAVTKERVQVIDRSIDMLEALSEAPCSLTEICRSTGLSKGTAFRLLAGLAARGMVTKDPVGNSYMLGPGLLRLVQDALSGIGAVVTVGSKAVRELSERTGETVALHVQSGLERVCVEEIQSPHSIRYSSLAGSAAPIYNGATGVVLLAFATPERRKRSLDLLEESADAIDRDALEARIAQARQDGWAVSAGERVAGATAISVPVPSELLLLALSVLGPEERLSPATLKSFVPAMRRTADHLIAVLDAQRLFPAREAS
jgi:DNA-binding IclR family transcriptional regulator